ncbi:MAG: ABC transporter permease [Methanothrix sp.]|nr:MAG: ABC transporter permease [Methanothrix sp.]
MRSRIFKVLKEKAHDNKKIIMGFTIIAIMVFIALFAPLIAPHNPESIDLTNRVAAPTQEYPLGTDHLGRCQMSMLVFGLRISLVIAATILFVRVILGATLGLIAGYFGGSLDQLISRIIDFELVFPDMVLALVLVGTLGPGLPNLMLALSIVGWSKYARIIRSTVISVKEKGFIESARALGVSETYIMQRHILPNSITPLIPVMTLGLGGLLLSVSGLSFIGLGVEPGTPELGMMIKSGFEVFPSHPQLVLVPSLMIIACVTGFTLLGDGLSDLFDPRKSSSFIASCL